ncbi:MAG: spore coat associated protein CotJA [Clostridiales bacterium]|nr:spore coat associated protein CotJA [Clostridiales bacterium]
MSVLTREPKSCTTSDCGCTGTIPAPQPGLSVGIATIPMQQWESIYEPGKGLRQGTIFPCLDMPFYVMESGWDVRAAGWTANKGGGRNG